MVIKKIYNNSIIIALDLLWLITVITYSRSLSLKGGFIWTDGEKRSDSLTDTVALGVTADS